MFRSVILISLRLLVVPGLVFALREQLLHRSLTGGDAHAHHRLQIREKQHVVTKAAQLWNAALGIVNLISAVQANPGLPLLVSC